MKKSLISAILLIAGTSIGAGMLALPVSTAQLGFPSAAALMIMSWYIMYISALLMLEVNLNFAPGANIISMASSYLGLFGKIFSWTIYLLLLYVLNSAYLSALSDLLQNVTFDFIAISHTTAVIIIVTFFLSLVYLGANFIDKINRALMLGLIASFVALIILFFGHIEPSYATHYSWFGAETALPVLATSFGFHIIIPSLRSFLGDNKHDMQLAILYGSLIPLFIYIIWQFLVFSSVPMFGDNGLLALWGGGKVTGLLTELVHTLNNRSFSLILNLFSFFIITTSFIGVSLSLFDFLSDGLSLEKSNSAKFYTAILTFLPPVIIVLANLKSFFIVLSLAGVFVALLLCLLPLAMVLVKRHLLKSKDNMFVGSIGIFLISFFALSVIIIEIFKYTS